MKRTVLYCVASSIILFILSFYFRDKIFDFFYSFFSGGNLRFQVHAVNSTFLIAFKVSVSIGIIPLILLVAWIYGSITLFRKRSLSVLIVIGCVALSIMVNVLRLNRYDIPMIGLPAHVYFPVEELYFEYAIGIGAISGAVISYFIFRKRKSTEDFKAEIEAIGK